MPITGAEIRRIRQRLLNEDGAPLTQAEFAALLGTTANTVARWERDERTPREPVALLIQRLASEQGVTARVTKQAGKKR